MDEKEQQDLKHIDQLIQNLKKIEKEKGHKTMMEKLNSFILSRAVDHKPYYSKGTDKLIQFKELKKK